MAETILPAIFVVRKNGTERFHCRSESLGINLLSFWQSSSSDLASNALRGRLAEYLVACALGVAQGVRAEWDAFDLTTRDGLRLEVKSAAYLQTWSQKSLSNITFDIAPTRYWDAMSNHMSAVSRRQSDLYVFALLSHRDKPTLDPLDVSQWEFLVLRTADLEKRLAKQKSISLARLCSLDPVRCNYQKLRHEIDHMGP
jgi:hypothetical protein